MENLIYIFLILAAAGSIAGFFAGLLGIGGGAIMVPVLFEVFRFLGVAEQHIMHLVLGTSFAIMMPTSLLSFRTHLKLGNVRLDFLKSWSIFIILGVITGWLAAAIIPTKGLQTIFASGMLLVAMSVVLRKIISGNSGAIFKDFATKFAAKNKLKMNFDDNKLKNKNVLCVVGYLIGLLSHLMGIGGGVFSTTYLLLSDKTMKMKEAVATSSGVGFFISIPALIGYVALGFYDGFSNGYNIGYVSWLALLIMAPLSMFFAPLGAKIAHNISDKLLTIAFLLFIISISMRFFVEVFY